MSIGERISELRKERNISQLQLAQVMDVTRQAVSKWENDQTAPDTVKLIQLADVLDTDVEYLATGRITPKSEPVVVKVVEKVDNIVEKIVEKPVYQVIEKPVYTVVEKPVMQVIEKPVIKKVVRVKYRTDPIGYFIIGFVCFLVGLGIGLLM